MWPIGDGQKQKRIIKFGKITSWDKQTNNVTIEKDFKNNLLLKQSTYRIWNKLRLMSPFYSSKLD